ncbi:MAG: hypothetical protein GKR91_20050 [Pseudomonadales bacterium]|nr:hypothetical protein [Pseudomonadales bacterium]
MDNIAAVFEFVIQSIFAEAFAMTFLLGFVLFLVGVLLFGLFVLSRVLGERIQGKVAGAVIHKRVKTKTIDGERKEVIKETLYPVFEYQRSDGTLHKERASEGGTSTLKYKTGQDVNLILREDDGYDADNYGALYLGLIFLAIGLVFMVQVGSMASAFGMGILSLVLVIIARIAVAFQSKARRNKKAEKKKYTKEFDLADLKPIEEFQV